MAVHRKTQKSLGNYDAKFLGPFTMRQSIWLGIGIAPSVLIGFNEYKAGLDVGIIFVTVVIIMAIPLFLGFGEKITYGMKPEDFARQYYVYRILAPKVRKYATETYDDINWKKVQKESSNKTDDEEKSKSKKQKKNVQKKGKFNIYEHKKNKNYAEFL